MPSQVHARDVLWHVMSRHDKSRRVMSARALSCRSESDKLAMEGRFPEISAKNMLFPGMSGKRGCACHSFIHFSLCLRN